MPPAVRTDSDRPPAQTAPPAPSTPAESAPAARIAIHVYPEMTCCKPGRQMLGLTCEAGWMVGCLANHCARLPTLSERRQFAARAAHVELLDSPDWQAIFKAEVKRLYDAQRPGA